MRRNVSRSGHTTSRSRDHPNGSMLDAVRDGGIVVVIPFETRRRELVARSQRAPDGLGRVEGLEEGLEVVFELHEILGQWVVHGPSY